LPAAMPTRSRHRLCRSRNRGSRSRRPRCGRGHSLLGRRCTS
jgi:hypothetical protein